MKKAIVLAIVLLSACKQGAWVSVDGSRLTESDVEKEMPDQYKRLKDEYNSQMRDLLEQVAVKKMMQKTQTNGEKTIPVGCLSGMVNHWMMNTELSFLVKK